MFAHVGVNYHAIYAEAIGDVFNNFFSRVKVITVFVRELSDLWCVNYHAIYAEGIGGKGGVFNIFFSRVKVIMVFVYELSGL